MRIKAKNLKEIEDLVTDYCRRRGICKDGFRIQISLSLKEAPLMTDAIIKPDPYILTRNSTDLWIEDNGSDKIYGSRIGHILNNIGSLSMYDLVHKDKIFIQKLRNMGARGFKRLTDWMAEYGLYFEMKIPPEVENGFLKLSGIID